jgi:hypothetical protein
MSLVGIETRARDAAQKTELATVQAAFDTDAHENGFDVSSACNEANSGSSKTGGVTDFTKFPSAHPLYPDIVHTVKTSQYAYTCVDAPTGTLGN